MIPKFLLAWINAYGVNLEALEAYLETIADKLDLPEEWQAAASKWLVDNATVTPEKAAGFMELAYWELKSAGPPGYNPDAGLLS